MPLDSFLKFLEILYALPLKKIGIKNNPEAKTELEFPSKTRFSQYFLSFLMDSCKAELSILFASNYFSPVTWCFGILNNLEGLVHSFNRTIDYLRLNWKMGFEGYKANITTWRNYARSETYMERYQGSCQSIAVRIHSYYHSVWKHPYLTLKWSCLCVPYVSVEYQLHQLHWQVIWLLLSHQNSMDKNKLRYYI